MARASKDGAAGKRRARRTFSDAQFAEMKRMYKQGASLVKVGQHFGVSAPIVRKYLNAMGVSTKRKPALTPRQRKAVAVRYVAGENIRQLAQAFSVSRTAIKSVLIDQEIAIKGVSEATKGKAAHNKTPISAAESATIRRMWLVQRCSLKEIADHLGHKSATPVHRHIQENAWVKPTDKTLRDQKREVRKSAFESQWQTAGEAKALQQFEEGLNFKEIADHLGVPKVWVAAKLKDLGKVDSMAKWPLDVRKTILREYGKRRGHRAPALARRFGLRNSNSVINFLTSRGVDTALAYTFSDDDLLRMKDLFHQGMGTHQIAAIFSEERDEDIEFYVVAKHLNEQGLTLSNYSANYAYTSPVAGALKLKSTWEVDVATFLDREVVAGRLATWSGESLEIPYMHNGKPRTYIPDFLLQRPDGTKELWEVKGKAFDGTREKTAAARALGFSIRVLREPDVEAIRRQVLPTWDWNWLT